MPRSSAAGPSAGLVVGRRRRVGRQDEHNAEHLAHQLANFPARSLSSAINFPRTAKGET